MQDFPVRVVAAAMRAFQPSWFIAGGWAVDLYLGEITRPHDDLEIAIFRRDQIALHDHLRGWTFRKVVDGKLLPWHRDEFLELPVHEIHCHNELNEPERLEVLLNESERDEWVFRRNKRIRRSLDKSYSVSKDGLKYLSPEIVLLYKSKNPRAKDLQDFQAVVKRLEPERRKWLKNSIAICDAEHPWLRSL